MSSESDLNVEDLHALQELHEAHQAALEEFQAKSERMTERDAEYASDKILEMKCDIELQELRCPKAAAAYHEE